MNNRMEHCVVCGFLGYAHKRFCPDKNYETLTNLNDRLIKLEKFMHENSLNIDYINSILERLTKLEEKVGQEEHIKELKQKLREFLSYEN